MFRRDKNSINSLNLMLDRSKNSFIVHNNILNNNDIKIINEDNKNFNGNSDRSILKNSDLINLNNEFDIKNKKNSNLFPLKELNNDYSLNNHYFENKHEYNNPQKNFMIEDNNNVKISKINKLKYTRNRLQVNFVKYFFFKKFNIDLGNIVKFNNFEEKLIEYLNIEDIILKLNEIEKLKYLFFNEKQIKIMEESKFLSKNYFSQKEKWHPNKINT